MTLKQQLIPPFSNFQKLTPLDRVQLVMGDAVQLIMKMENRDFAEHVAKKLKSELIAFRLKSDGVFFVPRTVDDLVLHRIPDGLNSVLEVDDWLVNNHPVVASERLGSIAANDKFVAINLSHSCGDGRYLVGIVDHIFDPIREPKAKFPIPAEVVFADAMKNPKHVDRMPTDADATRFVERGKKEGKELSLISRVNMKEFTCYDPATGKCRNLSDLMWVSYALAMGTMFDSMDNIGVQICVDMRAYMDQAFKKKNNMNLCNMFSCIRVGAGKNWKDLTLGECYKRIRKELGEKMKSDHAFGFIKMFGGEGNNVEGLRSQWLLNSHLGAIKIRSPIEDVWFSEVLYYELFREMQQTLTYSIVNETKKTNEHVTILKYGVNGVTEKEARVVMDSWLQGMRTFTPDMPMKKALSEMRKFQGKV